MIKGHRLSEETKKKISETMKSRKIKPTLHWEGGNQYWKGKFGKDHPRFGKEGLKGELHPNWKNQNISYSALHCWVRLNWGQPSSCETCKREDIPPTWTAKKDYFEWARVKNAINYRLRESWQRLCHNCHIKYDRKEEIC